MNFTSNRSLSSRLLIFVDLITLIVISGISWVMVYNVRSMASTALQDKIDSSINFLAEISPQYITNKDVAALEKFSKIAANDPDVVYAIFYDADGKPITNTSKIVAESSSMVKIDRDLTGPGDKKIGKLVAVYRTESIKKNNNKILTIAVSLAVAGAIVMTLGIWGLFRSILTPVIQSLGKLRKMSQVLEATSNDITSSSESLSQGVNQQASVVQQTTSAMTEMSGMLAQSTTYSKQSEVVMSSMTQKAKQGMSIMNEMVDAMTSVQQANGQLKQMAKIISEISTKTNVINDIVFKTQLLSFNASIEAARAGQHGRGFSVVAEEVGNLAKMSGNAAQEIAALLNDSEKQVNTIVQTTSERVNAGKSVAEQAMKNFKEIASEISETSVHISNISAATKEQEFGIAQTTEAMSELNKTAEANSGIAQRSNQAANTLKHETKVLSSITRSIHDVLLGKKSSMAASSTAQADRKAAKSLARTLTQASVSTSALAGLSGGAAQAAPAKRATISNDTAPARGTEDPGKTPSTDFLSDKIVEMAKKRQSSGDMGGVTQDSHSPGAHVKEVKSA